MVAQEKRTPQQKIQSTLDDACLSDYAMHQNLLNKLTFYQCILKTHIKNGNYKPRDWQLNLW